MSPLPKRMTNHWWWRPGVRPGRRLYVWHVLFDDRPGAEKLVEECRDRLAGLPGLDSVPTPWLHMTTQIVGFTDEISDSELQNMITAVSERMRSVAPTSVSLGRPLFHSEALVLGVDPRDGLDAVRAGVRQAVAMTVRANRLTDDPDWVPHLSVAYSNSEAPAEPVISAMQSPPAPVDVRIDAIDLVSQERVGHSYIWDRIATVQLGPVR
ncbi:2'-5' RNA ligase family protein [Actinoallomurus sp. NPDC052308]|uniref:2'-5' RNA ligase family protein n=1 Tax=Actinoallomurus sp. NPDC052308 TaxID=3155530 RepID=UPI003429F82D